MGEASLFGDLPSYDQPPVVEVAVGAHFLQLPGLNTVALVRLVDDLWRSRYPRTLEQPLSPPGNWNQARSSYGGVVGAWSLLLSIDDTFFALRKANIEVDPELRIPGPRSKQGGFEAAVHLLSLPQKPTAVVCWNDLVAIGMMNGIARAGLVPGVDISVTGYDGRIIATDICFKVR